MGQAQQSVPSHSLIQTDWDPLIRIMATVLPRFWGNKSYEAAAVMKNRTSLAVAASQ